MLQGPGAFMSPWLRNLRCVALAHQNLELDGMACVEFHRSGVLADPKHVFFILLVFFVDVIFVSFCRFVFFYRRFV